MSFWRELRWRIVAAHMAVVIVGVTLVLSMAALVTTYVVPADIAARVADLSQASEPAAIQQATATLLNTFRRSILTSVSVAALGAILTGIVTSLLLARQILRPLRQLAASSQRIANGRYDERLPIPGSDELASVATHFNQMAEALAHVEAQRVAQIANVSHELRTPLSGLQGYLEGLQDGLFPNDEATFAQMAAEVDRLKRLVDDLQALSRVEAGQINLAREPFALAPLVERLVAQMVPRAAAQQLRLEMVTTVSDLRVDASADRVTQVLLNLIDNAIRYTPEDGCITVRIASEDGMARVSVADTGIGIPADALPYIFERFYRVDPSRARTSGGSGIGLTIARHMVWMMGGELTAASAGPDQGSTFTFTLPLAKD